MEKRLAVAADLGSLQGLLPLRIAIRPVGILEGASPAMTPSQVVLFHNSERERKRERERQREEERERERERE